MQKLLTTALCLTLWAAAILSARAFGQQPAAPASAQTPATTKPAVSPQSPAPKPKATAPAGTHRGPATRSQTPLALKTQKDKLSYSIGLNIGRSIHKDALDVDPAILARGVKDAMAGGKTLLTDDEAKAVMVALQNDMRKQQEEKMQLVGATNKKEGDSFLADNKAKDGVVTLPSGLQYKVLQEGTGPKPAATDSVVCNYKGTLLDGTEFDSSYKRGQPATFPVSGVIKGWTEALQLMPVGSKWQLFIPADLAYGARGAGGTIGPNATLVFEIELLSIQPKAGETEQPK